MKETAVGAYQREQIETLRLVLQGIGQFSPNSVNGLRAMTQPYLDFRREVDQFHSRHFSDVCTQNCYESRLSACCSKDGIITFFADVVINALSSTHEQLRRLEKALDSPNDRFRCVYLSDDGCLWAVKPVVCAMFLCDSAEKTVFSKTPEAEEEWKRYKGKEKAFKWPDRPVLFDRLEKAFLDLGIDSPLMYFHNSPGLLRVKRKAGLIPAR